MLTILQARDFAESSDANRAFSSLVAASGGEIRLVFGDKATHEELILHDGKVLIDTRVWDPHSQIPCLKASHDRDFVITEAIDTRVRTLPPQIREEDVIRVITPMAICKQNGFFEVLSLWETLEAKGCSWHWYVLGRPEDEEEFDQWTEELERLGLADNITLVGEYSLEKSIKLAMNMDFALLPKANALSLTLVEQLQLGLPLLSPASTHYEKCLATQDSFFVVEDWTKDSEKACAFLTQVRGQEMTKRYARDFSKWQTWKAMAKTLKAYE